MTANVEAIVREGINAFKAGRREEARTFLMKAVELDQYNEQAWLWLSAAVDSVDDQRTCLENVLAINPDNARARNGLQVLAQQTPDPFAQFNAARDDAPTSVEWAVSDTDTGGTSTEPGSEQYDDWVANLNLPATSSPASAEPTFDAGFFNPPSPPSGDDFSTDPFVSVDDDDVFAPGEVPPPPTPMSGLASAAPASAQTADGGDFDFETPSARSTGVFATISENDDFGDVDLGEMDADELFRYIPPDIQPTRLPGTVERYPAALLLGFVLLLALNLGAAALLIYRLL